MLKLIKSNQKNFLLKLDSILQKRKQKDPKIDLKTRNIIQDIKKNKDKALIKYEKKYSKLNDITLKQQISDVRIWLFNQYQSIA